MGGNAVSGLERPGENRQVQARGGLHMSTIQLFRIAVKQDAGIA
jgi:hypothetical protein